MIFATVAAGCRTPGPNAEELREATQEMMAAAQNITSRKSEVTVRPEMGQAADGSGPVRVADHLEIVLDRASEAQSLQKALDAVASRHGLVRLGGSASDGAFEFEYGVGARRTHSIQLDVPTAAAPPKEGTAPRAASGKALLAVIIDDLGYDRGAADAVLALRFPLTVAVLPNHPLSTGIAEEAHRRGEQVMLHLPMEAESGHDEKGARVESVELRPGMDAGEVDAIVTKMLATVPYAAGVNNHQGSRATTNAELMDGVMRALAARHLFFIDSRTTAATIAYDTAERDGVRAAWRNVFLDDVATRPAVLKQLRLAVRDAQKQGWAIAIGHPHPATIVALAEYLPHMEAQGIRLVLASDVTH
ncbi:MAG: divergent polysaccharide deacetylase family protein [Candidatus Acidiferrales bacterium]